MFALPLASTPIPRPPHTSATSQGLPFTSFGPWRIQRSTIVSRRGSYGVTQISISSGQASSRLTHWSVHNRFQAAKFVVGGTDRNFYPIERKRLTSFFHQCTCIAAILYIVKLCSSLQILGFRLPAACSCRSLHLWPETMCYVSNVQIVGKTIFGWIILTV